MNSAQAYDAIIIGSGQGGNPLAHKLADLEWNVALIERKYLGGSCINYGCTPTKTMLASARIANYARQADAYGVQTGPVSVDLARVVERKNEIVQQWRDGHKSQVEERPTLDLYRGTGRFVDSHTIAVDGQRLSGEHIFIDTGSSPRILDLPGLDQVDYYTNMDIIDLTRLPQHLLVLGGSYLGLEFGQMFRRFGSRVTIVEYNEQIMPREDADVAQSLQDALEDEGITFRLGARASEVAPAEDGLSLTVTPHEGRSFTVEGSHLLLAVGRVPNTDALNLEAAGIAADERGHVIVNEKLETNVPNVWAIGDVKGGPAFTHISYDDHLIIYDNLINGAERTTEGRIIPYALYTDPELGRVGMTEKAAREAGYDLKVGQIPMTNVARATERGETEGMMKLIVNAEDERILGAAILGSEGGELVQTLMTLMRADLPWTFFKQAMFIHPTMTEGFFSLMDSVQPASP